VRGRGIKLRNSSWLFFTAILVVTFSITFGAQTVDPAHFVGGTLSSEWVDFYGTTFAVLGAPAEVGDELGVFDPDGVLCGAFVVHTEGVYGFLHVYGDDSTTPAVDEGAIAGDALTFVAWDASDGREIPCAATVITGSEPPQWTADGDIWNVNLSAVGVPEDVTDSIAESRSQMHVDRVTGIGTMTVTITNVSADNLVSPMTAVIDNISSAEVTVANADGVTPEGKPSFDLNGELGDGVLSPGESVAFTLQFYNPDRVRFTFDVKVFAVRP
jgi:hypothetical protein